MKIRFGYELVYWSGVPSPVQLELKGPDFRVSLKGEGLYVLPSDLLMTQLERQFGRKVAELV